MAFNLLITFSAPPDWRRVNALSQEATGRLEFFPVDHPHEGVFQALAVSVPRKHATPETCELLSRLLVALVAQPGTEVHDLYAGTTLPSLQVSEIHKRVLGQ